MKKVVLIDDNQDILAMWKMFLEKLGHETLVFSSISEFEGLLSEGLKNVGCIICDQSLNDGLGSDLFNRLIKLGHTTPFIIVSGYGEEEILAGVEDPSALKVMKKPVSLAELKGAIEAALN